jgi:hypothetical protein
MCEGCTSLADTKEKMDSNYNKPSNPRHFNNNT